MSDQPFPYRRVPFSQPILDGREFCQLTLPVWPDAESFNVTVLVKVAVIAPDQARGQGLIDWHPVLVPEARVITSGIVGVANVEIDVPSVGLPEGLVFFLGEGRGVVEMAFKTDEITEAAAV
jgi:hypothetical protein